MPTFAAQLTFVTSLTYFSLTCSSRQRWTRHARTQRIHARKPRSSQTNSRNIDRSWLTTWCPRSRNWPSRNRRRHVHTNKATLLIFHSTTQPIITALRPQNGRHFQRPIKPHTQAHTRRRRSSHQRQAAAIIDFRLQPRPPNRACR